MLRHLHDAVHAASADDKLDEREKSVRRSFKCETEVSELLFFDASGTDVCKTKIRELHLSCVSFCYLWTTGKALVEESGDWVIVAHH